MGCISLTKYVNKKYTCTSCLCTLSANTLCHPTHLRLVRHPHTCAPMNGFQQPVHTAPSVFCAKKSASGTSQLHPKQSSNEPYPENFMTIGGCFECYTYRIMVLVWLKKEEQRKKERNEGDEQFWFAILKEEMNKSVSVLPF